MRVALVGLLCSHFHLTAHRIPPLLLPRSLSDFCLHCSDTGGHIVALRWALSNVYGIQPGERMWAASDPAWVVGSSWIVWGPALGGATSTLYEGKPVGTPDAASFWRVLKEHKINSMFAGESC